MARHRTGELFGSLPLDKVAIENSKQDWPAYQGLILQALAWPPVLHPSSAGRFLTCDESLGPRTCGRRRASRNEPKNAHFQARARPGFHTRLSPATVRSHPGRSMGSGFEMHVRNEDIDTVPLHLEDHAARPRTQRWHPVSPPKVKGTLWILWLANCCPPATNSDPSRSLM